MRNVLAPIGAQEIWAGRCTWLAAEPGCENEESKESGGATFYDKVYVAESLNYF